ncbi:MAG: hypothetical protein IMY72_05185 [Bacteroidetes bacterium]|nr:hypothetical protein [Bacteroidota bacterium]
MKNRFIIRIKQDLKESRIDWKLALLFIPIAFFTYLFHEFGHWLVGELLGNDMVLSLNNSNARNGYYIEKIHTLYISMGGPAFTILQAVFFLLIIEKTKSIYAYPFVFFAAFIRFFSIFFGGIHMQDEARISSMLNVNIYIVPVIVLLVLFFLVWRSSYLLKMNVKVIGYYITISTFAILLVIGVNYLIT